MDMNMMRERGERAGKLRAKSNVVLHGDMYDSRRETARVNNMWRAPPGRRTAGKEERRGQGESECHGAHGS